MKKSIIAAGAASAVLAAMPVVGVFAETVTDNVQLTITESCSMTSVPAGGYTSANAIDLGTSIVTPSGHSFSGATSGANAGSVMTSSCNDNYGWQITAEATALTNQTKAQNSKSFAFGAYTEGSTAVWSAQLTLTGADSANATITEGWRTFAGAKVASGTEQAPNIVAQDVNGQGVSGIEIATAYQAWAPANQEAGTYTGNIIYTFGAK